MHVESRLRELLGSEGFQVRPMKTAKVNREFTFTMPSRAVMWTLVPTGIFGRWRFWIVEALDKWGFGMQMVKFET